MPAGWIAAALGGVATGAAVTLLLLRRAVPPSPAQHAMAQAQRQLIEVLGNNRDGVALYDDANRLVTCNRRYGELLRPIAHLLEPGARFEDLMASLALAEQKPPEWLERKLAGGGLADGTAGEDRFRNGHWINVSSYATTGGGQLRILRDITPRKQSEQALVESQNSLRLQAARLQNIIDTVPQGVAVFDTEGALAALNVAAIRMLELPNAAVTPGTIDISLFMALLAASDHPPGLGAAQLSEELAESLRAAPEMVFEHFASNGTILEVRSNAMPDGGLLLTFTDITGRKRVEQTLREARDEAERGNRAKNTFLANISHELRTPLNAIIGFSEMMKHEIFGPLEPANYRAYVDDIHESGQHLLELINDILDMSKAEAGMTDLLEAPVQVPDMIHLVVRQLTRAAERGGIALVTDVPPLLPPLLADERRLRQIILNLGSNAVKFTEDGGRVTISASAEAAGFVIRVADTGIGMSPEDLERVMEPFVQADTRLSRKYEGSGLGLPLAKALAGAHGASLEVESRLGQGTTVTVTFPPARIVQDHAGAHI